MEFDFNINHIFPDEVTLIGEKSPFRNKTNSRLLERNLQIVIDTLGKRSAKAQQLTGSITTFLKSQLNNHRLYILKDDCANNGSGCVIGFLKVGKKRLFVLDRDGNHNEMNPLCVLDFYVHESQQRKGCGLFLFKHMLSMEATKASHLAIDRPSHKFISFLKKHFNLWATIPQVNNFVIFDGFFKNRSDMVRNSSSGSDKSSQFRPLSRAVSDGIIKRNRQSDHTVMSTALKDIRPVSGSELYNTHYLPSQRNNRRRKWNNDGLWRTTEQQIPLTRPNIYSRFFHESTNKTLGLPPLPAGRHNCNGANLTTNLYRRGESVHNDNHIDGDVLQKSQTVKNRDIIEELRTKDNGQLGITINNSDQVTNKPTDTTNLSNEVARAKNHPQPQLHSDQFNSYKNSSIDLKPSSKLQSKPSIPSHLKPSTIIEDLKAKDEAYLSNREVVSSQNHSRLWYQRQLQGTHSSWNVLGVPTRPYWKAQ